MKNLLFILLLVAALVVAVSVSPVQAGEEQVAICHVPPGNSDNARLILVGASAVPAHLAHGDSLPGGAPVPNHPPPCALQ